MLKFDLISVQFALHYAFETENKLLNFVTTLKYLTKSGSILLASWVRDEYIYDRMEREGKIVGNTNNVSGFDDECKDGENINNNKSDRVIGFDNSLHSLQMKFNIWNKISSLNTKYRKAKSQGKEKVLPLIGIPYVYHQRDSVNHDKQYIISFDHLCKLLEVHVNMKKIFDQSFDQLIDKFSTQKKFNNIFAKRKLHQRKLTKDELQVISMYRMCMFERL